MTYLNIISILILSLVVGKQSSESCCKISSKYYFKCLIYFFVNLITINMIIINKKVI